MKNLTKDFEKGIFEEKKKKKQTNTNLVSNHTKLIALVLKQITELVLRLNRGSKKKSSLVD